MKEKHCGGGEKFRYGNHGLYYANSLDGGFSWNDTHGKLLADTRKGQRVSIDSIGGTVVDIPMKSEPSNTTIFSELDPLTGNLHVMSGHYTTSTTNTKMHHYIRESTGDWTSKITELPISGGALKFTDDYLFSFLSDKIFFAKRSENFLNWEEISIAKEFPKGSFTWDLGRINEGIVSVYIQNNPNHIGEPSPVEVFDLRIAAKK